MTYEFVDEYYEEDLYQITNSYVTLYKDGKEIAYGRMGYSLWECQWIEEEECHQREGEDEIVVWWDVDRYENGKVAVRDEDYDKIEWGEEREEWLGQDWDKANEYFKKITTH